MATAKPPDPREADIVKQMARKLVGDIVELRRLRDAGPPATFPRFREIRNKHHEIQGLIVSIADRLPLAGDLVPANFAQWLVRQKLNELALFTDVSHGFISDPPLALTQSLGAFDVLQSERQAFTEVLGYFDQMLMEAGIDDKTADELDATRTKIEEILGMVETLLEHSPKVLQEFD
ncbi:hypothetical protein [Azospirillum halopraeferens]|uniref:hypothetical protein n=1 Tax=Azospirillum halopraeferens TaxID=34010 RepID=UPI0004192FD7|nr:hypothetical protein [Azospirillum halopraeferens]